MTPNENNERHSIRWSVYLLILTIFTAITASNIINVRSLLSANDRSRWCTVWSLVERGSYQIDLIDKQSGWTTIDKVRHNGHFYSTKPPLLPTLVAGVYWSVKKVTGWDLYRHTNEASRTILLIVNLLPMLLAALVMIRLAERYAINDWARIFTVAAFAFGTMLSPFLVTLNNHSVAATCVVLSIYPALRVLADNDLRRRYFFMSGFFAAFVVCNELPAALYGVALFLLMLRKDARLTWKYFVTAALIPIGAFFVTNFIATGGWKPFYMYYGTEKYLFTYQGVPSYWMSPRGLDKGNESPLVYFLHCTIGHHGLITLTPLLLLTMIGVKDAAIRCWTLNRNEAPASDPLRQTSDTFDTGTPLFVIQMLAGFLTVSILAFYLSRTSNYNYGGNTAGLRWTFWLIPFWLIATLPVLDRWSGTRWKRRTACVLLGISIISASLPTANPWSQPWAFTILERLGYVDYRDRPSELPRKMWSWIGKLPESTSEKRTWIELAGTATDGDTVHWRLTDYGRGTRNGRQYKTIHVWPFRNNQVPTEQQPGILDGHFICIDVEHFEAGQSPSAFLLWPSESAVASEFTQIPAERHDLETSNQDAIQRARSFIRGLPNSKAYNSGFFRYLKTTLRADAFRCQRSAAQVVFQKDEQSAKNRHRIDIWYCDDLPFGVARVELTVTHPKTGEIFSKQIMNVVATSENFDSTATEVNSSE